MSKIKIYYNHNFYYILQGANVAELNIEQRLVRQDSALNWLSHLSHDFVPEVPMGTEEYKRVLYAYKEIINRLPLWKS
ncbi:hypothetical protein JMN32_05250 [Fulvivirga sp. 29W222]|uniref:Uncharacterized protein n=1 Tax=Fulvivirga marina TaxID=2494733 RepID=A0A937FTX1_9BACT|nr:hypothetical protein [Fulvivirga marina]MBL6445704.1 hypothetical protein [Fulvivirga marina]